MSFIPCYKPGFVNVPKLVFRRVRTLDFAIKTGISDNI